MNEVWIVSLHGYGVSRVFSSLELATEYKQSLNICDFSIAYIEHYSVENELPDNSCDMIEHYHGDNAHSHLGGNVPHKHVGLPDMLGPYALEERR